MTCERFVPFRRGILWPVSSRSGTDPTPRRAAPGRTICRCAGQPHIDIPPFQRLTWGP